MQENYQYFTKNIEYNLIIHKIPTICYDITPKVNLGANKMTNCHNHNNCVDDAIKKAEMICKDRNLSLTPLRHKVLELLWEDGHTAIKAYDLLDKLQKKEASAKPVTVYRALDFLLENHLIHKLESLNSFIGCNHPTLQHDCAFLICKECNEVTECCDNSQLMGGIKAAINPKDFCIKSITLELSGVCKECF
jgi:Fur family zinc uptake transcriptional regulator